MIRTQIQLTEEQSQVLKQIVAEENISIAELVRRSVDQLIRSRRQPDREERKRRALSIVGQFPTGLPDLAENHDRYLAEAYGAGDGRCI